MEYILYLFCLLPYLVNIYLLFHITGEMSGYEIWRARNPAVNDLKKIENLVKFQHKGDQTRKFVSVPFAYIIHTSLVARTDGDQSNQQSRYVFPRRGVKAVKVRWGSQRTALRTLACESTTDIDLGEPLSTSQ